MPEWFNEPGEVLAIISIVAAVLAGLMWLIKAVDAVHKETLPNHGSSLRDSVDRIERQVERVATKLDEHIDFHLKEK